MKKIILSLSKIMAFSLICFQINANGRTLGHTSGVIEAAVMFWAFYYVINHKAIGQMNLLMCTQAIGCIKFV